MEKTNRMKHISILTALALACTLTTGASAQNINRLEKGQEIPDGVVIYSLPLTTIRLDVEAICETYTPGPYCQWAKKYLGIDVPQEAGVSYTLSRVEMTPYLEADRSCSYIINLDGFLGKASPASFFEFSTQGLIVLSDENFAEPAILRIAFLFQPALSSLYIEVAFSWVSWYILRSAKRKYLSP